MGQVLKAILYQPVCQLTYINPDHRLNVMNVSMI